MEDASAIKTVQLSTYEMLTLVAKLPALMRDASRVGPAEYRALASALNKIQAAA